MRNATGNQADSRRELESASRGNKLIPGAVQLDEPISIQITETNVHSSSG